MHVQNQYQDILEKYVAIVSEKWGESVEDIILFGSVARGDAGEDSDIDLLIVVKEEDYRIRRQMISCAYELQLASGKRISVKVLSKKDFDRTKNFSFLREVISEGIRIA